MPKTRPPYPRPLRARLIELARSGRSPEELGRQFEPSAQTIRNWRKQADRDDGRRADGLTTEEREEGRRLCREVTALREEREILRKAAAWFARETPLAPVQGFEFVRAHQGTHRVATVCRVLGVSTRGYDAWQSRPRSARAQADRELFEQIRTIHERSRGTSGAPRIHAELAAQGLLIGRKQVTRLMQASGLAGVRRRAIGPRPGGTRRPGRRRISSNASSPRRGPIACGSRTSPPSPRGPGSSSSPSCWTPGVVESSDGPWRRISARNWSWTR